VAQIIGGTNFEKNVKYEKYFPDLGGDTFGVSKNKILFVYFIF